MMLSQIPQVPTIQQRTRSQLTDPAAQPQAPQLPSIPQIPQVGALGSSQTQAPQRQSMFAGRTQALDQGMAAAAGMGGQPHVPIKFLVGTAVANSIARRRGYTDGPQPGGGRGSYTGPGLNANGNSLLRLAKTQLGVPYVFGDIDPRGGGSASFDCSGLTAWAFGRLGIQLPHSAAMQSRMFPQVGAKDLRPGDLVFYDYGRLGGASDHVAIYIGNGQQIAASSSADQVTVQPVDWSHFIWGGRTPFAGGGGGGGQGGRGGTGRRNRGNRNLSNTARQRL